MTNTARNIYGMLDNVVDEIKRIMNDIEENASWHTESYPIGDGYCYVDVLDENSSEDFDFWEEMKNSLEYRMDDLEDFFGKIDEQEGSIKKV